MAMNICGARGSEHAYIATKWRSVMNLEAPKMTQEGRTYVGVKTEILPLYLKGRFYAIDAFRHKRFYTNIPVLYLTGTFYVKNFSAYSLVCNQ